VEFVHNVREKLRSVSLNVLWVEIIKLFHEYLLSVNNLLLVNVSAILQAHRLNPWLKVPAQLNEFSEHILVYKTRIFLIFTNFREHIEECRTCHQRLQTNVHEAVDVLVS